MEGALDLPSLTLRPSFLSLGLLNDGIVGENQTHLVGALKPIRNVRDVPQCLY